MFLLYKVPADGAMSLVIALMTSEALTILPAALKFLSVRPTVFSSDAPGRSDCRTEFCQGSLRFNKQLVRLHRLIAHMLEPFRHFWCDAQDMLSCNARLGNPGLEMPHHELKLRNALVLIARFRGTVRKFVCVGAVENYAAMALMKRSPKMTANWALAMVRSRGGIFHSFSDRCKIR